MLGKKAKSSAGDLKSAIHILLANVPAILFSTWKPCGAWPCEPTLIFTHFTVSLFFRSPCEVPCNSDCNECLKVDIYFLFHLAPIEKQTVHRNLISCIWKFVCKSFGCLREMMHLPFLYRLIWCKWSREINQWMFPRQVSKFHLFPARALPLV